MPQPQHFLHFISNEEHYNEIISRVVQAKQTLWIGTADIKDLYVKVGSSAVPFLQVIATQIKRGVSVRLIHAKEPGPAFREDFDRFPVLFSGLERMLCPRVHFKLMVFDHSAAYIGSANLTGAAMGMKSPNRRNFEAGILTNIPEIVEAAIKEFDQVWMGSECEKCGRKQYCKDPIK